MQSMVDFPEPILCPLCGGRESASRFTDRGYDVRQCRSCELFFIHPYPHDVDAIHETVTDYDYEDLNVIGPERHYRASQYTYRLIYPSVREYCRGASSVLDVGCGSGYLLERLAEFPELHRVGIELNTARAVYARRVACCEIFQAPVEAFQYDRRFDVITLINVLSHISSFDELFHALRELLSENGKLIIKAGEMGLHIEKGAVFDWGVPSHMHFLGLNTMQTIADKYGFVLVEHQRTPYSQEFFSKQRWLAPGRSQLRNAVKKVIAHTPYALNTLAKRYDRRFGSQLHSSLFVLSAH
ncbi:MAG: methyltransferase domain-containing protein [Chloroflexi bacterium]|nr:methyltransferase domain-containing protein [Chloroflexota bacterium]